MVFKGRLPPKLVKGNLIEALFVISLIKKQCKVKVKVTEIFLPRQWQSALSTGKLQRNQKEQRSMLTFLSKEKKKKTRSLSVFGAVCIVGGERANNIFDAQNFFFLNSVCCEIF